MDQIDKAFLFIILCQFSLLLWAGTKLWASRMKIKKIDREFNRLCHKYRKETETKMGKKYFAIGTYGENKDV